MKCFVTGATGFIGANLVHELVQRGHQVKALIRKNSDTRGLAGADIESVDCDICDNNSLTVAMTGCDWCFHVAASYHLWLRDYTPMYRTNVDGTRCVIDSAARAGCSRIVYTSTVGCIGLPEAKDAGGQIAPADETTPLKKGQLTNHYKRSKWQAEQITLERAADGLPVVIVNPSAPVGPRDVKPTPTGRIIVDFLNGQMPGWVETGLNWAHVRDVATGHILAAQNGRLGERYILGNAEGNWSMRRTFEVLAELTGLTAPRLRIPYSLALLFAYLNEGVSRITGTPPKAPVAGVRMSKYKMFFNPAKAVGELGLPQTPPHRAFEDAINWFKTNGYIRR
ncbi:MAG: NAD-dependent epimerase/dehydratase family protein [Verrucomicrobia bacterium]|nr:NAD-dependent epimerase/dehydratase family protein [Verrucomicrobiota bacterium]